MFSKITLSLIMLISAFTLCLGDSEPETIHYISTNQHLLACNNATSVMERESCYARIAISRRSPALCEEVNVINLYNMCIFENALKIGDINLCSKIKKDDYVHTECITRATTAVTQY